MAGSYPDVPGYRFAYDLDGTVVVNNNGTVTNSSTLRSLNSDQVNLNIMTDSQVTFLFPEPRTITGLMLRRNTTTGTTAEWSNDTTSGIDGTWIPIAGLTWVPLGIREDARSSISTVDLQGVTALRLTIASGSWRAVHIYGALEPSSTPNRLRIVDTSNDSTTSNTSVNTGSDISSQLDFGNIQQRALSTKQIRVVNNSQLSTANNITVTLDTALDASPSLIGQVQLSTDNIAFSNAVNIGNLSPGSHALLYVRYSPAAAAQLSTWSVRLIAHAVTWS